ncbi:glycosyltransferase [Vibrio breoganii]
MKFHSVAVIMAIYKGDSSDQVEEAFDSIFRQTFPVSIFLMIDGPIDANLEAIVDVYAARMEVRVFKNEISQGLAKSLNLLLDKVLNYDFTYIARMDSDDISLAKRIEKQVSFLESNTTIDLCGSYCEEFGSTFSRKVKKVPISHDEIVNFSVTHCPFVHPTVMFRSSVFADGVRYPTSLPFTEDMGLWFHLIFNKKRMANIPEVLLRYRMNEQTLKRRQGFGKAISESRLRLKYMFKLNKFTLKNLALILSRFIFHMLPEKVLKFLYTNYRG